MNRRASSVSSRCASAVALLVVAGNVSRFAPAIRLHDQAMFELCEIAKQGDLALDVDGWRFVPSANGGYALVGLTDVLLVLSEEGWLQRDRGEAAYVVTPELRERGARDLASLTSEERHRVSQVAERWKARASVSSKKAA